MSATYIESAKTYQPRYERGQLVNGQEIAPDVYMDRLPQGGEVRHIAEDLYLAGHSEKNIADLNQEKTLFKHIYVTKGTCEVIVAGQTVQLETGDVLHLGSTVEIQVIDNPNNTAEFLTLLHDPKDIEDEVKQQWMDQWLHRKSTDTKFGYFVGAFVDEQFLPAKTATVAVGTKVLSGSIVEDQSHSHIHQFELNGVIGGAYEVDITSAYQEAANRVAVGEGDVLVVGEGLFSGTRNERILTNKCHVFLIQTPNLQPSPEDKSKTLKGEHIKSPTWTKESLLGRARQ